DADRALHPVRPGRGSGSREANREALAWLCGHRTLIETRQMAHMPPLRVEERYAQVALGAQAHAQFVAREPLAHTRRVMTEVAADHVLTGRADHIPLEVVGDSVSGPEGQGPRP